MWHMSPITISATRKTCGSNWGYKYLYLTRAYKGYEYSATKYSLNTMAESVIFIREHGIKSVHQLDEHIQKSADERQHLQDKIKSIDKEMIF